MPTELKKMRNNKNSKKARIQDKLTRIRAAWFSLCDSYQ